MEVAQELIEQSANTLEGLAKLETVGKAEKVTD